MEGIAYFFYSIASVSYLTPFLFQNMRKNLSQIITLKLFLIIGFSGNILMLFYSRFYGNPFFIAHIYDFIQYILLILLFKNLGFKFLFPITLIPISVFLYESVFLDGWLNNNELFYVISTLFISVISFIRLYQNLTRISDNNYFFNIIHGTFFICSISSIILGIYENEIRDGDVITAFFLIFLNNFITIVQNIGINLALWKLKEA